MSVYKFKSWLRAACIVPLPDADCIYSHSQYFVKCPPLRQPIRKCNKWCHFSLGVGQSKLEEGVDMVVGSHLPNNSNTKPSVLTGERIKVEVFVLYTIIHPSTSIWLTGVKILINIQTMIYCFKDPIRNYFSNSCSLSCIKIWRSYWLQVITFMSVTSG